MRSLTVWSLNAVAPLKVSYYVHQRHEFVDMGLDFLDPPSINNAHLEALLHPTKKPLNFGSNFVYHMKTKAKLRHIPVDRFEFVPAHSIDSALKRSWAALLFALTAYR